MKTYTVYIDESGTPELTDHKSSHILLCGVLLDSSVEDHFLFLIQRIKSKYGLDHGTHIHAVDVFEKKSKPSYLGLTKRRKKNDLRKLFREEMWELIREFNIKYHVVSIPKDLVKKSLRLHKLSDKGENWIGNWNYYARIDRQLPVDIGANVIYRWAFSQIGKDDKLKIVFESRSGDAFSLRNFGYVTGNNIFSSKHMAAFGIHAKKSVTSITFATKGVQAVGLELADFIAYTCNVYFLQIQKRKPVATDLKQSLLFRGFHKTMNRKHYKELQDGIITKYIPGFKSRTKRISKHYAILAQNARRSTGKLRGSLSPANAGAQVSS